MYLFFTDTVEYAILFQWSNSDVIVSFAFTYLQKGLVLFDCSPSRMILLM